MKSSRFGPTGFSRPLIYLLPILATALLGGVLLYNLSQIRAIEAEVASSHELLLVVKELWNQAVEAETGHRGYLITGDSTYLAPYHAARFSVDRVFEKLTTQMQVQDLEFDLAKLKRTLDDKFAEMAVSVQMRERGETEQAFAAVQTDRGRQLMDAIRDELGLLEQQRTEKAIDLQNEFSNAFFTATSSAIIALLINLAAINWALLRVDQELLARTQAEADASSRVRQLRAMTDIVARISSARDLYSVFGIALNEYRQLIGVREAIARVRLGDGVHYESSLQSSVKARDDDTFFKAAFMIADMVADEDFSYFRTRNELESIPGVIQSQEWQRFRSQIDGLLTVPMIATSRGKIGRLLLIGKFDGDFDEGDLSLSMQLAQSVAVAVENARLTEALTTSARRKDEFLAMLGHELRNPLAGILTGTEALFHPSISNDEQVEIRQMLRRQSEVMNHIINDLLDVSRIARGKISLVQTPFNLKEATEHWVEDFQAAHPEFTIQLKCVQSDEGYWMLGDQTRISQCVTNLLHNAIKFSPPHEPIHVELQRANGEHDLLELCVIDHGVGLERDELEEIFDLFHQVGTTIDRTSGGLGLGLTLARGIVEMHGGLLRASSQGKGQGATFCIQLPSLQSEDVESYFQRQENRVVQRRAVSAQTVLTIDDRADARLPIRVLLSKEGHRVIEADSATLGIEMAIKHRPEVIFCDIGLPGDMNGFDVARRLRLEPSLQGAYVVALSGYSQTSDRERAAAAGFDYHVAKPVSFQSLTDIMAFKPRFSAAILRGVT